MKYILENLNNMFSKQIKVLGFVVLAFFVMISSSWAASYYVDKNSSNASDFNAGTESNPWKTIQKGANVAVAGDIVYVKNGVYYEWVDVKNSGIAGAPITFMAYPGDTPIIDGSGVSMPLWRGLFRAYGKNYITIDGFEIRNSKDNLVLLEYSDYFKIMNCEIHDNLNASAYRNAMIIIHSNNGLIDSNEVYNAKWNGINVESSTDVTISNNYSHHNIYHNGVNIFPKTSEAQIQYSGNNVKNNIIVGNHGGIYTRYQINNEISNNLIHSNINYGIYFENDQASPHTFQANTKIFNNTIVSNGGNALLNGNATHLTIKNNIFAYSSSYAIYMRSGLTDGHDIDNNLYYPSPSFGWDGRTYGSLSSWKSASHQDANSTEADPYFTSRSSNDFSLTMSSVHAIDKGLNLSSVGINQDILGTARPQGNGFDIGAYEYKSINRSPVAVDDSAATKENEAVTINVLSNDTDADGDSLFVSGVTSPVNGSASIIGSSVKYAPKANFSGTDTFTYTVNDGNDGTDSATVTVTVLPVLNPPSNLRIK